MKSRARTIIAVACAVLVAASLPWAWRAHSVARDIKNRQAKLVAQNASMKEHLAALNAQSNAGADNAGTVEKTNSSPKNSTGNPETALERFGRFAAEKALGSKRIAAQKSEYEKTKYAANRVELGIVYAPFFRMANLTPDQSAKTTGIILQRDTTQNDVSAIQREHPGQKDDPVWQQLRDEATDEAKAAIQSMLGDEGLGQFTLYDRQRAAWNYAGNIAAGLALADLPVSLEQSQKLAEAMSNASPSFQSGKGVPTDLADVDWSAVDAEAQKILTSEQFELFSTTAFMFGTTLPNTGSLSRWSAEFNKALSNALKPEEK